MSSSEKIKFPSTRFGELEVQAETLVEIVGGIIGFPGLTKFVMLEYNQPFSWLQSVERADLAFVIVDGSEFGEAYQFPLPLADPDLQISDEKDVAIVNLVSVRSEPHGMTVNMKAPVVVNLRNRKGKQIILDNPKFPVRLPLTGTKETSSGEKK